MASIIGIVASLAAGATSPAPLVAENTITTNPAGYLLPFIQIEFERKISDQFSVFMEPGWFTTGSIAAARYSAVTLTVGARHYPMGTAPFGWFVFPEAFVMVGGTDAGPVQATPGVGWASGYAFDLSPFVLSLGVGVNAIFWGRSPEAPFGGGVLGSGWMTLPFARLNVGFAF